MAYINYNNLWESEFDNIVSKKDKVQDLNSNKLKLEVNDVFKKDEKTTTTFEPSDDTDAINEDNLDKKLSKVKRQLKLVEKDYNEFKLHRYKQPTEEDLVQRAVETTIQIFRDKGLFDNFAIADEVKNNFCLQEEDQISRK